MTTAIPTDQTAVPEDIPEPAVAPKAPALNHQHGTACYWNHTTCCWSCKDGAGTTQ